MFYLFLIIFYSFTLIDIEIPSDSPIQCYRTAEFQAGLCCARNYLKITSSPSKDNSYSRAYHDHNKQNQQFYCGDSSLQRETYTSTSNVVTVEFNVLDNYAHSRGFYLEYSILPKRSALSTSSITECPVGKFLCNKSKLCIDGERRCNGVVDCGLEHDHESSTVTTDFSDELNCTSQLCRPEKGAFLCNDGRCILAPW